MDNFIPSDISLCATWGWQLVLTVALAAATGAVCGYLLPELRVRWAAPFGFIVGCTVDIAGLGILIFVFQGLVPDWMSYTFPAAGVLIVLAFCFGLSRWRKRIAALGRTAWKKISRRDDATDDAYTQDGDGRFARTKERTTGLGRTVWKEIVHRDDATDEEKKVLVEEMRNSPPISPMHAFLHPFMVVKAHRALKRYQEATWVGPRLTWFLMLGLSGIFVENYFSNQPEELTPNETMFFLLFGIVVLPLVSILISHVLTTVIVRMEQTCVWCHIVHRNSDGSIEAMLLISVYRLPFLDPSRDNPAPWQGTWWKSTNTDVTLETTKDVSQLRLADIYDETVCSVRLPTTVPPSAKRFVVGGIERHGDVTIREKRRPALRFGPQAQTLVITVVGVAASAIITLMVALLSRGA